MSQQQCPTGRRRRRRVLAVALVVAVITALPASVASARPTRAEASAPSAPPSAAGAPAPSGTEVSPKVAEQIQAVTDEKADRTPTEQKLDSNLLYAAREDASQPAVEGAPEITSDLDTAAGTVLVDIDANVTSGLTASIEGAGGEVVAAVPGFDAVRAEVPVGAVVDLAGRPDIAAIRPADQATTSAAGAGANEGDATHAADTARARYDVDGSGVKVCVLSDGVASLAERQATGDLPAVDVLPGQAGASSADEGTAMLELIHDVAPGAELGFATAFTSQASFAQNILDLEADGCRVMVDDVTWYAETTLQDANVAQAISAVRAGGVTYFSSAGNSGNLPDGTSGTWQGDFQDTGPSAAPLPAGLRVHGWGTGATSNALTKVDGPLNLQWADPVGGSANDYDLYVLDNAGTSIVASSTNVQNGAQNPAESITAAVAVGNLVVVTKPAAAASRYLVLYTNGGTLAAGTGGSARGHNVSEAAVSVAATPASGAIGAGNPAGPYPGAFSAASVSERYSSDGPTRQYFTPAGAAITPGDFSSSGGVGRNGVDLTAADGATTTTPGFIPFFGTSAAAPNAAALAALALDDQPALTPPQLEAAMAASAIDIEAAGTDPVTGPGIVMGPALMAAVGSTPKSNLTAGSATVAPQTGDGDPAVEPGETATLTQALTNIGGASATSVSATLVSNSANATVTQGSTTYGTIASGASGAPTGSALAFSVAPGCPCGTTLPFTLTVTYGGGAGPSVAIPLSLAVGAPAAPVSTAYSGPPLAIPDNAPAGGSAALTVAGTALIQDLTVTIGGAECSTGADATGVGIAHSYLQDMTLTLTSPQGTTVTLMNKTGASGNNLCQTVFSDSAATSIQGQPASEAPFTGSYRPATPLRAFDQQSPQGTWTLKAVDGLPSDAGSIRAFSLEITTADCTTINAAPVGLGDAYGAAQGATRTVAAPGVLANDTDADGNSLTAVLVAGPAHGSLTLNADGSFAYTPAAGYSGPDSFTYQPHDGTVAGSTATVSLAVAPGSNQAYVTAVYADFLSRIGDAGGTAYWASRLDRAVETRTSFVRKMSRSHEYSVKTVTRAFNDVLGRGPDPSGREFWANRVQTGMPAATLLLNLIASNEYLTKTGGTVDGFVRSTFNAILARQPTAGEQSARVTQINGGASRLSVASELYASTESRQRRTSTLFQLLLGRTPTTSELSSWVADLATKSDVDLAVFLGAGDEYYAGAQTP